MKNIIREIEAIPLSAKWETIFGGADKVPHSLLHPAAHYQSVPRLGQFATIVKITTEDGITGLGEAWGLPLPGITASIVNEIFRPMLLGRDASQIDAHWDNLYFQAQTTGNTRGFMMEAISGLDIALWDLRGKIANQPLNALVGPKLQDYVECYASPVRFTDTVNEAVAIAHEFVDQGFTALKVKAGRSLETDITYVASLREKLGPGIKLLVDFNCGYTVPKTIEFAREVEQYNIYWLEEPLPPENVADLATIRQSINIPLCTGENDFSPNTFRELLQLGAVDYINPNVTRCGGVSGMLKIDALAQRHGVGVGLHGVGSGLMLKTSLHLMSTFSNAGLFEYNRLLNPLRDELLRDPVCMENGRLVVPGCPGIGSDLNSVIFDKFRLKNNGK